MSFGGSVPIGRFENTCRVYLGRRFWVIMRWEMDNPLVPCRAIRRGIEEEQTLLTGCLWCPPPTELEPPAKRCSGVRAIRTPTPHSRTPRSILHLAWRGCGLRSLQNIMSSRALYTRAFVLIILGSRTAAFLLSPSSLLQRAAEHGQRRLCPATATRR